MPRKQVTAKNTRGPAKTKKKPMKSTNRRHGTTTANLKQLKTGRVPGIPLVPGKNTKGRLVWSEDHLTPVQRRLIKSKGDNAVTAGKISTAINKKSAKKRSKRRQTPYTYIPKKPRR